MSEDGNSDKTSDDGRAPIVNADKIQLKVVDPEGNETHFMIGRSTRLGKLMEAVSATRGVSPGGMRFMFDGARINPEDTPQLLGMDMHDTIDVAVQQIGGGGGGHDSDPGGKKRR